MHRTSYAAAAAAFLAACATSPSARTARTDNQSNPSVVAGEQAPSSRPSEGVGGHDPHPLPQRDASGQERYSGDEKQTVQQPGQQGRVPDSRMPAGAAATAPGAVTGSGDTLVGRVAHVDRQTREIAIDAGDATTQVRVADDADITVNGNRAGLDAIQQGAEVRASLDRSGDVPAVRKLEITSAK
jgi:hypothetical protein